MYAGSVFELFDYINLVVRRQQGQKSVHLASLRTRIQSPETMYKMSGVVTYAVVTVLGGENRRLPGQPVRGLDYKTKKVGDGKRWLNIQEHLTALRGPRFDSSQLSVMPVLGCLMPSSGILGNCIHVLPIRTCKQSINIHKIQRNNHFKKVSSA